MDIGSWGGGLVLALVAVLWLVYLVPTWQRRREYLATERNAVRLQQTLRILAQTAELPEEVRVGTVDKFQGQQATVSFFAMASSSGEDVPRGLDFLFSRNRLNVAVSRAKCLAYVVASPRLLETSCKTVGQMRLLNALCRFVELAEPDASER